MRRELALLLTISACRPADAPTLPTLPSEAPIRVAVTVDDLPAHGPMLPGQSRLQLHERMLEAFSAHRVPRVYGFINAARAADAEDNRAALGMLKETLLPKCNLFCYGQVESPYGSGEFYRVLEEAFGSEHEQLVLSEIENKEGIYESIKTFLGKGK